MAKFGKSRVEFGKVRGEIKDLTQKTQKILKKRNFNHEGKEGHEKRF